MDATATELRPTSEDDPHFRRGAPRRRGRTFGALAVVVAFLLMPALVSCGDDDDPDVATEDTTVAGGTQGGGEDDVEIDAVDGSFEPSTLEVTAGSTVTIDFENDGTNPHTFTIEELDVDAEVQPDQSTSIDVTFPEEPGTIEFVCRFHESQGMTGTFEVEAASGSGAGSGSNTTMTQPTEGSGDSGSDSTPEGGSAPESGDDNSGGGDETTVPGGVDGY